MAKRVSDRTRVAEERTARDRATLRDLGGRVRGLRETRGLSQERLAERAGLTSKFLGEVERVETNPSATSLARLAAALSVEVGDLFDATDELLPVPVIQLDHVLEIYRSLGQAIQELLTATDGAGPTSSAVKLPTAVTPTLPRKPAPGPSRGVKTNGDGAGAGAGASGSRRSSRR